MPFFSSKMINNNIDKKRMLQQMQWMFQNDEIMKYATHSSFYCVLSAQTKKKNKTKKPQFKILGFKINKRVGQ